MNHLPHSGYCIILIQSLGYSMEAISLQKHSDASWSLHWQSYHSSV
uniref:Uncharacterized protein n=1 Tax=Zea mays TaxID=4577 RepID=B7ZZG0_MAIZE|nr:unknown [Zea mays]